MSAYSDLVLSHGANAYWRLNEPSGTTAADSAGSRTGTLAGTGTVLGVTGRLAGELAMSFDGNGRILPSSMPSLGTAFTLEAWVKPSTTPPQRFGLISRTIATDGDFQWEWRPGPFLRLLYFSGAYFTYDGALTLPTGAWTHLLVTGASGQLVTYVNGVAQAGLAATISGAGAGAPALAGFAEAGAEMLGWQGALQDLAIYPRALTPAEILTHYTVGSTVESVPSAGCDHTTVWSKHLATRSAPTVESERAYLATLYGEPGGTDVSTLVSRWLQEITCGTAPSPPAAPTLSTVAPNTGTQGTMVTVTLTGTNFVTGATGVSVNGIGISVVNIQVLSPTSLTADLAIAADAPPTARSITVTTAGGSASQAFTVSVPVGPGLPVLSGLTLHVDASDTDHLWKTFVSGGPQTGVPIDGDTIAVWEREPDDAITHLLKQNAATGLPVWRSTTPLMRRPCLDFTGGQQLQLATLTGTPQDLSTLITAGAFTVVVAFWAESVPTNPVFSQPYGGGPLIGDSGAGYWGAFLHLNVAVPTATAYNYDGTNTYASVPITTGAAHVFMARHQSGTLYASLDGGAETSVASGATAVLTGGPQFGGGAHGGGMLDGRIGELVVYNVALTGANLASVLSYFTSKWL